MFWETFPLDPLSYILLRSLGSALVCGLGGEEAPAPAQACPSWGIWRRRQARAWMQMTWVYCPPVALTNCGGKKITFYL